MKRAAACDVGDSEEALALLAREAWIGLLHAAGVLHDKMLRAMSTDNVHAVFVPKACAASHAQAIMHTPLEAAGLFSFSFRVARMPRVRRIGSSGDTCVGESECGGSVGVVFGYRVSRLKTPAALSDLLLCFPCSEMPV